MFIDMHMHSMEGSSDSFVKLDEIVCQAQKMGLSAICITDHDNNDIYDYAMDYGKKNNFKIFVGAEILTIEGDIIVLGLRNLPEGKIHAQELIDIVELAGGVCIAAHPFRNNNRGCGFGIRDLRGLAGIEAYNGSTRAFENLYAHALAKELDIPCLGASDCHELDKIGTYATLFQDEINTEGQLIGAIKNSRVEPCVYTENGYRVINSHGIKGRIE